LRLLLDTHVLLWSLDEPERLGPDAAAALREPGLATVISVATLWEIAIKRTLGQLRAPENLPELLLRMGHELLDIRVEHAWRVQALPPHHRDPFDRLLVAQAQVENLALVTHDRQIERYDLRVIRA
jgi:PIN domain nuclease of toxin-antitoxin system